MAPKRKGSKQAKPIKDLKPGKSAAQNVKGGVNPPGNNSLVNRLKNKISGINPN